MAQTYPDIPATKAVRDSRQDILDRDEAVRSAFSGTTFPSANLVVGMFALVLAYRSPATDLPKQLLLSCVMCLSVAYCSYMYVDSLSFFRILAQAHMGWWYPVMLGVIVVILSGGLRRLVSNSSVSAP